MNTAAAELLEHPSPGGPDQLCTPGDGSGLPDEGLDLSEAIQSFLEYMRTYRCAPETTIDAYRADLLRLQRFLEGRRLPTRIADMTPRVLQAFAVGRPDLAPATITRGLNAISSMFRYLVRCGLADTNPVDSVIKPP